MLICLQETTYLLGNLLAEHSLSLRLCLFGSLNWLVQTATQLSAPFQTKDLSISSCVLSPGVTESHLTISVILKQLTN